MIYLKNNAETQTIFIPREAVSGGELINVVKGYDAGVEDGIKIGEQRQKEKLTNLYVTESGVYDNENGYDVVTVAIDGGECPEISLEKGSFTASENGEYVITPTEGFDGLESLNLRVDVPQEGGNCNLVGGTLKYPVGGDYNEFIATDYGYDGFEWLGVDATYHNEWMQAKHFYDNNTIVKKNITITENGEYSLYGYNGLSLAAKNFVWFTNVIPTIETDVEIWVIPYRCYNMWEGFIGSQNEDDDNSTFQIRRNGAENVFAFRFGEQTHTYEMKNPNQWYKLRMNRYGVWVNDEQIRDWEVNDFQENNLPLMINGINNPQWDNFNDFFRSAAGQYGYVYFHNLDLLYAPISSGHFVDNNNNFTQYGRIENYLLKPFRQSSEMNYNNITISVEGGESGNCNLGELRTNFEDLDGTGKWWRGANADGLDGYDYVEINANEYGGQKFNEGYEQGYNDGQANCGEGGGCVLEHLEVNENGYYEPKAQEFDYLTVRENSAFDTGVKLVDNTTIEIFFNTGDSDSGIPTLIGCEDEDWNSSTFAVRWFGGTLAVKIGTQEINIPMGAEDEAMKFHKLKFGRYEGVWLDDNFIEPFNVTEWVMSQNTIYIGAMHNRTNGDANGVWQPWNGYLGNVKIYGEKNGEVRDFTFTCGDFGRWGEYWAEGDILPNLMGDGGAILSCCKQYGDAPFDGYSSVSVNIDVEPYKEEGRNEIRNGLKTLSVNETGVFDINETFVKEVFVMNNAKIVGAKSSDNWENIKIRFASYTLTPEDEWLEKQHLFRLSNGLEISFHGGGIRVENSEQGNLAYNFYPNFNEVEVTNNSFRVNDQIQYFDYDLFEGADYNIWLGNMRETIISVELNGISLSIDDFTIQEGSIEKRVLDFKKFEGEGWNKVDVTIPPIRTYKIFAEFDDSDMEFFPQEHEKHMYYQFNGGGKSWFVHSQTLTYPKINDVYPNSFNKNDNVKEISLDVFYVNEGAFKDWSNLEKLTITNYNDIKADAFSGCSKLKEIHLRPNYGSEHSISNTAFTNIGENGVVYVRANNIENFVKRFYEIFPQSWTYVIE